LFIHTTTSIECQRDLEERRAFTENKLFCPGRKDEDGFFSLFTNHFGYHSTQLIWLQLPCVRLEEDLPIVQWALRGPQGPPS